MRNNIMKTVLGVVLGLSCSGIANAAKNPEVLSVTEWRRTTFQPCSALISFQATQNRNVSGAFDLIQYQIFGIYADDREVNFSADPWYGSSFSWDWVRGVNDVDNVYFYGPFGNNTVLPVRWEMRFFNGTNQYGAVGPHLGTFELENMCINNTAPIADAGEDIYYAVPNLLVMLDGTSSSDTEDDVLTYSWTQTSGPTVELINANFAK